MSLRILFVAAEMAPFVKVGGLADVVQSLPAALKELGHDVRVLIPAYPDGNERVAVESFRAPPDCEGTRLFQASAPGSGIDVWFCDSPGFRNRRGGPYADAQGQPYPDDAADFDQFCRVAAAIAADACALGWRPDVVHAHDWHTGLVPVRMLLQRVPAAVVFTIHNLAHQGLFPHAALSRLQLPEWLWHYQALEFHGQLSFMKGGLVFADHLTTVSPTYADEILTASHGCGLDGVLTARAKNLSGILNGIDVAQWDPASDRWLARHYSARDPRPKQVLKRVLQQELGLAIRPDVPLVGFIGRLVEQKGIDALFEALPGLQRLPVQCVVLGKGEQRYERALLQYAQRNPEACAVKIGFDEGFAHRLYAGLDMLLMPSRFEPCGLGQMYAMRYGTIPIVHAVGGLADTVVDASVEALTAGTATGICFDRLDGANVVRAAGRAAKLYGRDKRNWRALMKAAMRRDFSWRTSALRYEEIYIKVLRARGCAPALHREPGAGQVRG